MFRLERRQNPLQLLVSHTGKEFVERRAREDKQSKRERAQEGVLSQLNEDSSPLAWAKAINKYSKDLEPDDVETLYKLPEMMRKAKETDIAAEAKANKEKEAAQKADLERLQEDEAEAEISKVYGPTAGKLWRHLPVGGRTQFVKDFSEILGREGTKEDVEAMLTGAAKKYATSGQEGTVEKDGMVYPPIQSPKNLRGKEIPEWRENRRKENLPKFNDASTKVNTAKKEKGYIQQLTRLNPLLPKGLDKLIINPQTGEPYAVAQLAGKVSPATQLFLKTINDFTVKAKDSFGARVTNFDLERFMARLPGLLNSEEGRSVILKQMGIVNELDSLYEDALLKVYTHYGVGDVTPEEADKIARDNIAPRTAVLENEMTKIVTDLESLEVEQAEQEAQGKQPAANSPAGDELPPAAEHAGRIIRDQETGKKLKSDGTNWVEVQ